MIIIIPTIKYGPTHYNTFTIAVCSMGSYGGLYAWDVSTHKQPRDTHGYSI